MNNVYSNFNDHDVKTVVLYMNLEDNFNGRRLYKTPDCNPETDIISGEELVDLFIKGLIVITDNVNGMEYYRPDNCWVGRMGLATMLKDGHDHIWYSAGRLD